MTSKLLYRDLPFFRVDGPQEGLLRVFEEGHGALAFVAPGFHPEWHLRSDLWRMYFPATQGVFER